MAVPMARYYLAEIVMALEVRAYMFDLRSVVLVAQDICT